MRRGNRNNLLTFVILKQFNGKDAKNDFLQFKWQVLRFLALNLKFSFFKNLENGKKMNFKTSNESKLYSRLNLSLKTFPIAIENSKCSF